MKASLQTSPGFINIQLYREMPEDIRYPDPEKITYMQIENWEDEESLNNDLASAHVQHFLNTTGHTFELEIKKYSVGPQARIKKYPDMMIRNFFLSIGANYNLFHR